MSRFIVPIACNVFGLCQIANANALSCRGIFGFPVFESQWMVNLNAYATLWYYFMLVFDTMSTGFQRIVETHHHMTHDASFRCWRRSNVAVNICKGRSGENNSLQGLHMACRLSGYTPISCSWTCPRNPFVFLLPSCMSYRSVDGSKPREFSDRACPFFRCR